MMKKMGIKIVKVLFYYLVDPFKIANQKDAKKKTPNINTNKIKR